MIFRALHRDAGRLPDDVCSFLIHLLLIDVVDIMVVGIVLVRDEVAPPGVLFTFPSRYWFTIAHILVFRLAGWSRRIPTGFHVPRRTQDPSRASSIFVYRACTFFGRPFNAVLLIVKVSSRGPTTPEQVLVWPLPRSLAATDGITFVFFSSRY